MGYPPSQEWGTPPGRNGIPPPPPKDRTAEGILSMRQGVCPLRSRRRTFLFNLKRQLIIQYSLQGSPILWGCFNMISLTFPTFKLHEIEKFLVHKKRLSQWSPDPPMKLVIWCFSYPLVWQLVKTFQRVVKHEKVKYKMNFNWTYVGNIWRKWNFKYAVHFNVIIFQYVRETSFRTIRGQDINVIWFYAGSYYVVDVLMI